MWMVELKTWLQDQGLSVKDLANQLGAPRTTVEDWVYRGAMPSPGNAEKLHEFISSNCAHHWVIARANGPLSEGECQRCGETREFTNSAEPSSLWTTSHKAKTES